MEAYLEAILDEPARPADASQGDVLMADLLAALA